MRRALYVVLSTLAFLLLSPLLLLARKTRHGLLERFGFHRPGTLAEGGWPRVWLHGASAGDLQALAPMIGCFRERFPEARIFLTTITDTGRAMAEQRLRDQVDGVVYAPWDLPGATRRAVRALRPDLLVLEYAEIWPNLIHAVHASGARVVLTNGRFSPERLRGYRTLFALFGNPAGGAGSAPDARGRGGRAGAGARCAAGPGVGDRQHQVRRAGGARAVAGGRGAPHGAGDPARTRWC